MDANPLSPRGIAAQIVRDKLESRDFYELMQRYRHQAILPPHEVVEAFDAVKDYITDIYEEALASALSEAQQAKPPLPVEVTAPAELGFDLASKIAGLLRGYGFFVPDSVLRTILLYKELDQHLASERRRVPAAQEGWQPIATAQDGAVVDWWIVPKTVDEAYTDTSGNPINVVGHAGRRHTGVRGSWGCLWKAVAWMPLPAPPVGVPDTTLSRASERSDVGERQDLREHPDMKGSE